MTELERSIADWMIRELPPEIGPALTYLAAHFDTARPLLLAFFVSIAALEVIAVVAIGRWMLAR